MPKIVERKIVETTVEVDPEGIDLGQRAEALGLSGYEVARMVLKGRGEEDAPPTKISSQVNKVLRSPDINYRLLTFLEIVEVLGGKVTVTWTDIKDA